MNIEYLYKYDSKQVSLGLDQFDEPIPGSYTEVYLHKFEIIKRTPKGAWIREYNKGLHKRFVLLTARKQFASNTKEKAKECFIKRKERYLFILQTKINNTVNAINKINLL